MENISVTPYISGVWGYLLFQGYLQKQKRWEQVCNRVYNSNANFQHTRFKPSGHKRNRAGIATITRCLLSSIYHSVRPQYKCVWAGPGKLPKWLTVWKNKWENNNKWKVMTHQASVRFMSVYPALLSLIYLPGRVCAWTQHNADERIQRWAITEHREGEWSGARSATANDNIQQLSTKDPEHT